MLKGLKNQGLSLVPSSHVDLFVEHYDQLKRWALQFTNRDQHAAEDLLHDTFIALTLGKPDLSAIHNLDGYLYTVMRNLHLSEVRRAARMPVSSFSVAEYDTAEMPFWVSDPREHIRMRDELAAVCQYACARKESSKGGSLLILRFFHGYYPDEIASVMKTIRSAVTSKLTKVCTEVKLFLEEPDRLSLFSNDLPEPLVLNTNPHAGDLRLQLREYIFDSCQGEHLDQNAIDAFYSTESSVVPDRTILAHIVSCETCIEKVNLVLGLPSLASRYPLDMVGKDPGKRGGSDSGGGMQGPTSGGTGGKESMLDSYIKRRDAHFYHEPRELCIAVNGQFQGLQKIVSGKGELMLPIDMNESLGFVEVFSELGVRLLMMPVKPPPIGDGDQFACVELSNGRTIDANLNFGGTLPSLRVAYNDPELISALAPAIESMELTQEPNGGNEEKQPSVSTIIEPEIFSGYTSTQKLFSLPNFLQPFRLATAFTLLLIIALVWLRFGPSAPVSAAELLANSAKAEDVFLANPDRVLHRTLNLEEFDGNGQVRSRKKIDVWQSSANGITARRLYDETGSLVMGDWRRSDGVQTIYKRGDAAKLQPLPEKRIGLIGFDDAWQLSLSAKEFTAMLDRTDEAQLEIRGNTYFVSYNPQAGNQSGIINASLVLNRDDLHPIEQAFTIRNGDETRSFRMVEASYEWRPQNSVAPTVFEPGI